MTMPLPNFMLDMMPDIVLATPGGENDFGGWVGSTPVVTLSNCLISVKNRLVRNSKGEVVTSSATILVSTSANNLNVKGFRYSLPNDGRFDPHGNSPQDPIEAIKVAKASEGKGPSHEIIYLP